MAKQIMTQPTMNPQIQLIHNKKKHSNFSHNLIKNQFRQECMYLKCNFIILKLIKFNLLSKHFNISFFIKWFVGSYFHFKFDFI